MPDAQTQTRTSTQQPIEMYLKWKWNTTWASVARKCLNKTNCQLRNWRTASTTFPFSANEILSILSPHDPCTLPVAAAQTKNMWHHALSTHLTLVQKLCAFFKINTFIRRISSKWQNATRFFINPGCALFSAVLINGDFRNCDEKRRLQ